MSKKTNYLLGILLTIIFGAILYYFFCCKPCLESANKGTESKNIAVESQVKTTKNAFSINDSKNNLKFNSNDNFNFKSSSFSILEPVSNGLKSQIERLSTYIKDNPNKTVDITGRYTSEENNTSTFPNLGLARANAVKNYFVSNGIPSNLINTFDKLDSSLVADASGTYYGPLSYNINTKEVNDTSEADALKALRQQIIANPLVLYFNTSSATINLNAEQRVKLDKMLKYVDKVDSATIKTIGHTDSRGDRATNVRLGLNRAEFAKNYLVNNGVSSSKINSSSKGPDNPISDNNTAEGRAKNRRVVVTLN